jgi:hypothetical protein
MTDFPALRHEPPMGVSASNPIADMPAAQPRVSFGPEAEAGLAGWRVALCAKNRPKSGVN